MTKIVLHPTYFPSIVQMATIVQADAVCFEIHDNYQKQTYRNRAYIAHSNGKLLLNVPVKHSKEGKRQKTNEVKAEDSFPWQSQHWKSLQSAYRTSPFFEFYEDELEPLFLKAPTGLMDHNLKIYELLSEIIGIDKPVSYTTTYQLHPENMDLRFLVEAKKEKVYTLDSYTQVLEASHGFLTNLSVLDLLFNEGPNAFHYLENQKLQF